MSWVDGSIWIGVGFIPLLFASGSFPLDVQRRTETLRRMPILANKPVMFGAAICFWLAGSFVVLNDVFRWGLPL